MTDPIYEDGREPKIEEAGIYYTVRNEWKDKESYISLTVYIDTIGLIVEVAGNFCGELVQKMQFKEQIKVYQYLVEWELITLKAIGPEDSEYFATYKLCEKYGYEQ